jgi:cyclophilin family peptidyl-prolyl cis-trans isomerase
LRILYKNGVKIFFGLLVIFFSSNCTKKNSEISPYKANAPFSKKLKTDKQGLSNISCILKTIHGDMVIKFYPKEAPQSVPRILELISMGFYNGLKFHRVIPNFIIQTGDPTGTGDGGSGQKLNAEFNTIPHIKGTVALARGRDVNSGDSQFYISLTALPHLDGKNTVIGQVVSGLEILNKINKDDEIISFSVKEK